MSSTSTDVTARVLWQRWRAGIAVAVLIVVIGALYAFSQARTTGGAMDPGSAQQDGARALAVLLEEQGVRIVRTERLDTALEAAGAGATLLVTVPDLVIGEGLDRLKRTRADRVVLLEPGETTLEALAPGVYPAGSTLGDIRAPGCDLAAARRAGAVETVGRMYRVPDGSPRAAQVCYSDGYRGSVVRTTLGSGGADLDVVGLPASFQNARLADHGNAALAMNLLGAEPTLVWYLPSLTDPSAAGEAGRRGLVELLPAGIRAAAGMAAIAALLVLLAAARRLGPVVPEKLPVVVRASETVEGRARLYRRVRARERAAAALRASARARLSARFGLPTDASDEAVISAVSGRTGRSAVDVADLMTGETPADDYALVRLADDLDQLEEEVRRT